MSIRILLTNGKERNAMDFVTFKIGIIIGGMYHFVVSLIMVNNIHTGADTVVKAMTLVVIILNRKMTVIQCK